MHYYFDKTVINKKKKSFNKNKGMVMQSEFAK